MPLIPYVVGQWVCGQKFYGRARLIAEILEGNRNSLWLLGTRRIGKTSLLKQLEHITTHSTESGYFPLFWDFQGVDSSEELRMSFSDSLLDAEERLETLGVAVHDIETDNLFTSLSYLRRKLRSKQLRLLLLCDEVEELIQLNVKDSSLLSKLRRTMQSHADTRTVLASSIRLWALASQKGDTSPFLHGFAPALYIRTLSNQEALSLIRQENLPLKARPCLDEKTAELIRSRCDNHPYLIQLTGKRYQELNDIEETIEQVTADEMISYFFSVDFGMLSEDERNVINLLAERSSSTSNTILERLSIDAGVLNGSLHRLERLGYIRRNKKREFLLVNYFFKKWLSNISRKHQLSGLGPSLPLVSATPEDLTTQTVVQPILIDNRYELVQEIGSGATGTVFKTHDRLMDEYIAIKWLKKEYAAHEEAFERIRHEILLSRDINHPNILRIYHLGESEGRKFLTMKWVDGVTLRKWLSGNATRSLDAILTIAKKLTSALEAAHSCDILHRDIKPENILIDADGEPYLADFGLARLLSAPGITSNGIFLGTPYYCSPEQACMAALDEKSDIYSLGLVLYEMVLGQKPFTAKTSAEVLEMHREQRPPDPCQIAPGTPRLLADLILRCLEKDPQNRYQCARDLLSALESLKFDARETSR